MPPKDLEKLIKLCRKYGLTSLKLEGVEFTLEPGFKAASKEEPTQEDKPAVVYTDEDILTWSSSQ